MMIRSSFVFIKKIDLSRHVNDVSRYDNLTLKRGDVGVKMTDTNGKVHRNIF